MFNYNTGPANKYIVQIEHLTALENMALDAIRRGEHKNAEILVRVHDLLSTIGKENILMSMAGTNAQLDDSIDTTAR